MADHLKLVSSNQHPDPPELPQVPQFERLATVGELLLDMVADLRAGRHNSLDRRMRECAEWLKDIPLPPDEDEEPAP